MILLLLLLLLLLRDIAVVIFLFFSCDFSSSRSSDFADLDSIIQKGEKKAAELEARLKDAGLDALQNFSLDGGSSVYDWEGLDWRVGVLASRQ